MWILCLLFVRVNNTYMHLRGNKKITRIYVNDANAKWVFPYKRVMSDSSGFTDTKKSDMHVLTIFQ